MVLYGITKEPINVTVMHLALASLPTLFIDAANCCDVHAFAGVEPDAFQHLYTLPAESLYRFRPTLLRAKAIAQKIGTKKIFISTARHLFAYGNEQENQHIYGQAWRLMHQLAYELDVYVGIIPQFDDGTYHTITTENYRSYLQRATNIYPKSPSKRTKNSSGLTQTTFKVSW